MAEKGWTAQLAAAAGVAAGTGAAQLGLGYGLGVVAWPATITDDDSVWLGSLGWATWIAASATVFGAVIASRLASRPGGPWRFALAVSAAIGAVVTVALIALPARASVRVDTFAPQTIAAGYAVVGILFGLVIAYWAVGSRPVAANLIATAAWLWALAVAAIVVDLIWHRPTATYLSSWQFASSGIGARYGTIYWPSSALTLLAALLLGVIAAWPAVRRGDLGVGAASSGAVGPLLVAAAFFALAPRLTGALGPLESAYLIAPYAVLSGLAGSAMTVATGRRIAQRRARRAAARVPEQASRSADRSRSGGPRPGPDESEQPDVLAQGASPARDGNPMQRRPAQGGITVQRRNPPQAEDQAQQGNRRQDGSQPPRASSSKAGNQTQQGGRSEADRQPQKASSSKATHPAQRTPTQGVTPSPPVDPTPDDDHSVTSPNPSRWGLRFGRRRSPKTEDVASDRGAGERDTASRSAATPSNKEPADVSTTAEPAPRPRAKGRLRGGADARTGEPADSTSDSTRAAAAKPPASDEPTAEITAPTADRKNPANHPAQAGRREPDAAATGRARPAAAGPTAASRAAARPAAPSPAARNASATRPPAPKAAAPKASTTTPSPTQPPPTAPDPVQPPPSAPSPVTPARSTVAPPPATPPVAKINPSPPNSGTAPTPRKAPAKKANRPAAKDE
jgi:hypothetical protein